jgi:hypothetical protein
MRHALSWVISVVVTAGALGCGGVAPRTSLAEARRGNSTTRLEEGPLLVRRDDRYVLRYRFAAPAEGPPAFAMTVFARREADAGYYYFAGVIQSTVVERGRLIERSLAEDGLDDLAREGRVYWLDPDGTRHPIPVEEETPQ